MSPSLSLTCACDYCASASDPTTIRLLIGGDQDGLTIPLTPGERATCQLTAADRLALAAFLADHGGATHVAERWVAEPPRGPVPKDAR